SAVGQGNPDLIEPRRAWDDNPTAQNFVLVQWRSGTTFDLVAVNLAPHTGQCYAMLKLPEASAGSWTITDLLGQGQFVRKSDDLREQGLYLDLPAHGAQLL